jgi:DNA-binding transcriptional MerR regulator
MTTGITISRAAAFAAVMVRTIRYHHRHGLTDGPRRDGSGGG